jgi:hypothetical protein
LPNLIKTDNEGAEPDVLQGYFGLIGEAKPIILSKVSIDLRRKVYDFLNGMNYSIYSCEDPARNKLDYASANTLAIPAQ